ncbi:hypothetical protein LINGRAHAP2_LOCUS31351 [Linum grandiflorum]
MLRALSSRRSHSKYEKLVDDSSVGLLGGELRRSNTLPVQYLGSGGHKLKLDLEVKLPALPLPAKKSSKSHPLFSFFDTRRKKRTTSRPEFARYVEYVKEGGRWDNSSGMPVIY